VSLQKITPAYATHVKKFSGYDHIADPQFQEKPDPKIVQSFVNAALDACSAHSPDWLSVPQLPLMDDSSRNKINRLLAESSRRWKDERSFSGLFIVPAIFTNQRQINKKTERNKKLVQVLSCLAASGAGGVWVVDSSLNDQEGSGTFDKRFLGLRQLHEELNKKLPDRTLTICGPYWGMNLVLWARELANLAAIGLGNAHKYNIPGASLSAGNVRIALTPLRRWAIVSHNLKTWLAEAIAKIPATDKAATELSAIEKDFSKLQVTANARLQVAKFYKSWFHKFATLPKSGRALALYQDLSSAYVLGATLDDLPAEEKTGRKPERVAQQLMLNCL
jgi:hypothetical protein